MTSGLTKTAFKLGVRRNHFKMEKEKVQKLLNSYLKVVDEHTKQSVIKDFFKSHGITMNRGLTMHWNSTAYSYSKIPKETSEDFGGDRLTYLADLIEKEKNLINKLKEAHIKILTDILNHELDSR